MAELPFRVMVRVLFAESVIAARSRFTRSSADPMAGRIKGVNVAILASPQDVSLIVPLLDAFKDVGISAYGLKIRISWEGLTRNAIESFVGKATHLLIVCSPNSIGMSWIPFAAGYGIGKGAGSALYRVNALWDPPRYLQGLPVFDGIEELSDYYRAEKAEWLVSSARTAARAALLEMGISYHAESLAQCVRDGDIHAVELFIKSGYVPDSRDRHGVPLLCLAVRGKHKGVTELLLDCGATLDLPAEDRGYTALMDAVLVGANELVELFLARGAEPNLLSKDGQTALVVAVGKNDDDIARRLLEYGADPDISDKLGLSARKYAKLFKKESMIALIEHVSPTVK